MVQTEFSHRFAQFSPDGRWILYSSDETGRPELYVQSFPISGARWQATTSGAEFPHWRRDGKELFYVAPDGKLMAMRVSGGAGFHASAPEPLFLTPMARVFGPAYSYDVSADGQRFLISVPVGDAVQTPITVVLNWTAGLKQ
jgi:hypothetical protein